MSRGITFPLDERRPVSVQHFNDLIDYQSAVGGYIEAIAVGEAGMGFFVNEEARLIGLGINRRATLFWWLHLPPELPRDFLSGDVVLIGPTDQDGEAEDVPDWVTSALFATSTFMVEMHAQKLDRWLLAPVVFNDYFEAGAWAVDVIASRRGIDRARVIPRK